MQRFRATIEANDPEAMVASLADDVRFPHGMVVGACALAEQLHDLVAAVGDQAGEGLAAGHHFTTIEGLDSVA